MAGIALNITVLQINFFKQPVQNCTQREEYCQESGPPGSDVNAGSGRNDKVGNSTARPPGLREPSEWVALKYRALQQAKKAFEGAAQHASRLCARVGCVVQRLGSIMQSWSKALQAAKAKTAARKAAEEGKKIKDIHAGKGALGAGKQMMQAEADEKKKQEDEGEIEKQRLYERKKQEQTNYVEELLSEMDRLDLDMDVGTALKKNEALILRCLTQASVSNGKKGTMIAKGGGDIGLLSKKYKNHGAWRTPYSIDSEGNAVHQGDVAQAGIGCIEHLARSTSTFVCNHCTQGPGNRGWKSS